MAKPVACDAVCTGANAIARLVRNPIDAHILSWLIWPVWLAVSDAAVYSRIFDSHLLRPNRRGISLLVRTSNTSTFTLNALAASLSFRFGWE
jgi:hypothetical protein